MRRLCRALSSALSAALSNALPLALLLAASVVPLPGPRGTAAAETPRRIEFRAGSGLVAVIPRSPLEGGAAARSREGMAPSAQIAHDGERPGWALKATLPNVLMGVTFCDPLNGFTCSELGGVYRTTNGGNPGRRG
jgi:hypothetical protein